MERLDEFQEGAMSTSIWKEKYNIIYTALGLASEAGEVAGKVKKVLRDNDGAFTNEKKREIADELGDVLYYVAAVAHDMGYKLSEIADMNHAKLASRKARGVIQGLGYNR